MLFKKFYCELNENCVHLLLKLWKFNFLYNARNEQCEIPLVIILIFYYFSN